jgi:hypothetical protein
MGDGANDKSASLINSRWASHNGIISGAAIPIALFNCALEEQIVTTILTKGSTTLEDTTLCAGAGRAGLHRKSNSDTYRKGNCQSSTARRMIRCN